MIEIEGVVVEKLPNATFQVELETRPTRCMRTGSAASCRMNYIRILPGDKVTLEMSPVQDLSKGTNYLER